MTRVASMALLLMLYPLWLQAQTKDDPREEVRKTEAAFAKTMADRDHAAFTSFLAEDAVFFGQGAAQRGKENEAQTWKRFFEGRQAPFSWAPGSVEVLDGGDLGFSSGPVFDPAGRRVGTFNSVWRKGKDGAWRIVFDNGCPRCECLQNQQKAQP
jgi:ketosteroid isomerase-like protein